NAMAAGALLAGNGKLDTANHDTPRNVQAATLPAAGLRLPQWATTGLRLSSGPLAPNENAAARHDPDSRTVRRVPGANDGSCPQPRPAGHACQLRRRYGRAPLVTGLAGTATLARG